VTHTTIGMVTHTTIGMVTHTTIGMVTHTTIGMATQRSAILFVVPEKNGQGNRPRLSGAWTLAAKGSRP
jgi:hypothetical protein